MTANAATLERLQSTVANSLHWHWRLFLSEGIVLLMLGLAAIVVPQIATIAADILLGWLLLVSGIVGLIATLKMRHAPGFVWSLLSAILGIVAGVVLLQWPLSGTFSLTVILSAFLVIEGLTSILFALDHKRELSGRWGVMLASGCIDLCLAAVIVSGFPGTAVWAIGMLIGVNLVFGACALIAMALHARHAVPAGNF